LPVTIGFSASALLSVRLDGTERTRHFSWLSALIRGRAIHSFSNGWTSCTRQHRFRRPAIVLKWSEQWVFGARAIYTRIAAHEADVIRTTREGTVFAVVVRNNGLFDVHPIGTIKEPRAVISRIAGDRAMQERTGRIGKSTPLFRH